MVASQQHGCCSSFACVQPCGVRPISDGPQLRVALLRQFTSALVPPQAVYCSVGTSNLVGVFSTLRQVRPEG